ncbi:PAS domain-containing sensor histidine kinase [Dehalogenimonas alkenigignens]|uniref:histidine kinase n=1 Tax=Dehalogenimonas alkenigignens TaxID=1217799 RepID=A0A0W0GI17_9CHLR|nr:PAS domain S-box protein [Dehalogenimonas alkenigignens]KTB48174.1 PAS domain S-box [Dehalogenimonas alkenigignens]PVV84414.1 PAS domain-containing sensor histidine kinase [Dehalogenimonas alkenigignens]
MPGRENGKNQISVRDSIEQRLLANATSTFRTMFERSGTAKAVLNEHGIIVMANETLARLVDLSVAEIEGKHSWFEFVAESDRKKAQEYHRLRRSHPGTAPELYEFRLLDHNGSIHEIEINVAMFPGTELSLLSLIDNTHLKTAQEMGRLTRFAVENAPESIFWLNESGALLYANAAACRLLGYNLGQIMSLSIHEIDAGHAKRDWLKLFKELRQAGSMVWQSEYRRQDGHVLPVELMITYIQLNDKHYYWAFARDVTATRQAEKREQQLQTELNVSGRLASVGELAAGVAHEINNPLTGIIGFSERLLRKATDEKLAADLKRIHSEALRAARVVQNLLTFARQRQPSKEPVDVNSIVKESLALREYELRQRGIQVVTHLAELPCIMADQYQLEQVLVNLIVNAEQAIAIANKGDRLTVTTGVLDEFIVVTVADNGPGIKPENLDKLFDPFFTTRVDSGGTGLGLSICHGIVAEHGGRLTVSSELGSGAVFTVALPLKENRCPPPDES